MLELMALSLGLAAWLSALTSARSDNTDDPRRTTPPRNDPFPLRGTYTWTFQIPAYGTQVSTNIFSADSVEYDMAGKAYSVHYMLYKETYDAEEGRWIGRTGNDIYYVIFFKDQTDTSVTIYKHKCANREEAYTFPIPAPDAEDDHGWNVYLKQS